MNHGLAVVLIIEVGIMAFAAVVFVIRALR